MTDVSDGNTAAPTGIRPGWLTLACVVLIPAAGLFGIQNFSWLDALTLAGVCAAVLISMAVLNRRAWETPAGRVWTMLSYLISALLLSPAFVRGVPYNSGNAMMSCAFKATGILAVLLWLSARAYAPAAAKRRDLLLDVETLTPAERLEEFAASGRVRLHLLIFAAVLLAISAQLSGSGLASVVPEIMALALALLAARALLRVASHPAGARAMNFSAAGVLAACAIAGFFRYSHAMGLADEMRAQLKGGKTDEALNIRAEADAINDVLKSRALGIRLETEWAEFYERSGDFPDAGARWGRVADLCGIARAEFLPSHRILWKMGDSLSAWRRLVFGGFPAIKQPEVVQGILDMGDRPGADLRARLLGAMLACELKNPPDDCKRRLEAVQAMAPHEISSHILLEQMDAIPFERSLVLPNELLTGHEPTFNAITGTVDTGSIEEQGEVRTVLVLAKGHYEMLLSARATPLLEQWPIIRVELDGQEIGRTQVVHSDSHGIPFTFDVKAPNVFVLRIVFENYVDAFDAGSIHRRGLSIDSVTFQHAKE